MALVALVLPLTTSIPASATAANANSVLNFGDAGALGSPGTLNQPIVGMASTPTGKGYWLVASDGGIFTFGDAPYLGSEGAIHLNQPIVGMASTPSGNGYWLVASDGGIFTFGDAPFLGSEGAIHLNQPVVGMASTPTGKGYWLVASDGGIFTFGDAPFLGSEGAIHLNQPIVGMASTPSGKGYWLVAADGGIFTFGDAPFLGSTGGMHLNQPIVGMAATPTGRGYWLVAADGSVYNFGDAPMLGSAAPAGGSPFVAVAPTPTGQGYWLARAGVSVAPANVRPLVFPPFAGEGQWVPAGRLVAGASPVYVTTLRTDGATPPTALASINQSGLRTVIYAGSGQPAGAFSATTEIDPSLRPQLVAAFNGGFLFTDSPGGYYEDGIAAVPLVTGDASLVVFADGSATVGQWGRDVSLAPNPGSPAVSEVLQNLPLLVDNGVPAANVGNVGAWGVTLGSVTNTWRSGIGVDASGRLIYAAGPGLDPAGLARVLVAAGCVRAMELDINPMWPHFVTFTGGPDPGSVVGADLLAGMFFAPDHYFSPDARNFVAIFAQ